jgi:hypothetical protein
MTVTAHRPVELLPHQRVAPARQRLQPLGERFTESRCAERLSNSERVRALRMRLEVCGRVAVCSYVAGLPGGGGVVKDSTRYGEKAARPDPMSYVGLQKNSLTEEGYNT